MPLVVIECKAPDIAEPVAEGIEQLMRYQNRRRSQELEGVPELFYFNQFVVSTCFHDARYSTITGQKSHFIEWKDPYPYKLSDVGKDVMPSSQEILVAGMLEPSHLIDIVRNFTVYNETDEGKTIKAVPRYMQYRGTRKIIARIRNDKAGGTLWHTQGSGKSLTMMFVIRKMYNSADLNDYKIVLIIDRTDLQKQIFETSRTIKYPVNKAGSIEHLKRLIANDASDVTIAMVHKFGDTSGKTEKFPVLNTSDRILVMIDEAHRSEYSELAANMWRSMPKSIKVAFSGTPITKTVETFGGYLDKYTMRQAQEDGVTVEIKYEGRATDSEITDHDAMNRKFVDIFGYMETEEQEEIMGKYGSVLVRAPKTMSDTEISAFVHKKRMWIRTKQEQIAAISEKHESLHADDGDSILYLGNSYVISKEGADEISIDGDTLIVPLDYTIEDISAWLKVEAGKIIQERVDRYASIMGVKYASVKMSDAKARWGSCSSKDSLNFAWRLVLTPLGIIDYVVVHELSHITYKNHSSQFWARVKTVLPHYKEQQDWLKANRQLMEII